MLYFCLIVLYVYPVVFVFVVSLFSISVSVVFLCFVVISFVVYLCMYLLICMSSYAFSVAQPALI